MKIKLNHKKLSKALSYASRAVSAKPNIPILSNVLMEVSKTNDSLRLSATNLDMGINMWIAGSVEGDGLVTVNAKYISDFVSATSSENVEIDLDQNNLNVKTQKSKATFTIIPAEEYPVLPEVSEIPIFKIKSIEFIKSMDKVLFACSTDLTSGRIQQSGVLFEIDGVQKEVHFIGLDGFRLSKRVSQITDLAGEVAKEEIIVPARYLAELVKILGDYPEVEDVSVFLSKSNSQIVFKFDDIEFSIRLLEGPYPEYKKILPTDNSYSFDVEKKDLEEAIKIANTFARGNLGNKTLFDFDIENSVVKLKSAVADVGEGETEFQISNPVGESDLNTAYTLRYLQDIVNHISGERLTYESKGALAATVIRDSEDAQFLHLVMPMRRD